MEGILASCQKLRPYLSPEEPSAPRVVSEKSGILAGMTKGVCSVCNAQPEVLEAVNAAIRAKEKFRDLAARTAFSRAALHRHASKCIPRHILTRDRELKTTEGSKIITQTPVPGRH